MNWVLPSSTVQITDLPADHRSHRVAVLIPRARYRRKLRLSPTTPPLTLPLTTSTNWGLVMVHSDLR